MADLIRWEPLRDMMSLRNAMDRLFEDAWVRPWSLGTGESMGGNLPVDVYESDDEIAGTARSRSTPDLTPRRSGRAARPTGHSRKSTPPDCEVWVNNQNQTGPGDVNSSA